MIAVLGLVPFSALPVVDPSSTVKVDGVFASQSGSCSLSYPRKSKNTGPNIQSTRNATPIKYSANLRCCRFSSSIFGSKRLMGFKDDWKSNCRSRRELDLRCNGCHDSHERDSADEEEYYEPSCRRREDYTFKQTKPATECSKPSKEGSDTGDADQVLLFSLSILSSLALGLYGVSRFTIKPVVVLCVVRGQKNLAALVHSQRKTQKPLPTVNLADSQFLCSFPILSFLTVCLYSLGQYVIEPRTCTLADGSGKNSSTRRTVEEFAGSLFTKLYSRIFIDVPAELLYQFITSVIEEESKADEP